MTTRIELFSPNPTYFNEDGAPQFKAAAPVTLSTGVDYIVGLTSGPVLLWFKHTGAASDADVISFYNAFGRKADISQTFDNAIYTRKFERQGWADVNGDLNFNVEVDATISLVAIKL